MMNIRERDREGIWHPLTQHKIHQDILPIVRAKGSLLFDEEGKDYVDGIASWYTSMYGHCNPYITKKVSNQMQQLDQIVFSGFTHLPAVELAENLLKILPKNQSKIFFSDNGSTATEVGIKMALQYHHNQGSDRKVLLAMENGFHGDTFGAMSVSGLSVYNGAFQDHFLEVIRIPVPEVEREEQIVEHLLELLKTRSVAGFIYEPMVQGAAGMHMYSPKVMNTVLKICREQGVLLIADEVMTGFGKTGKNFASEFLEHEPDVVCMSKSLTAGLLPMAATSCTAEVYNAFYSEELAKGLFHGHTYTANPPACAAALAGIELLLSEDIQNNMLRIIDAHNKFLTKIREHPKVVNPRQIGVIMAFELKVEMERYGHLRDRLFRHFMARGVFLRPLGNTIYVLPAFSIEEAELQRIYDSIEDALEIF